MKNEIISEFEKNYPQGTIHFFEQIEDMSQFAQNLLKGKTVALSGGSTFKKVLIHWRDSEKLRKFSFFPADERVVDKNSEDSNWRMIDQVFLGPNHLKDQKKNQPTDLKSYKKMINFSFDQIFLGMGADGHTASLFPKGPELEDKTSPVLSSTAPFEPKERVSLGLKSIWDSKEVILIVFGKNKREKFLEFLKGNKELPVALAIEKAKQVRVLCLEEDYV